MAVAGWRSDRKINHLSWAGGRGPGPGAAVVHGQGRYGSGGFWRDGDGVAEQCFDLPDVVFDPLVFVGAGLVVAGAEVGVPGGGVGEQVPDDDQDGAGAGDLSLGLAAAAGDAPVAFAEEGISAGGADGGLAEAATQVAVALAFLP